MSQKIIIVKKKKGHGGGHHGGSWKVAYADFVTAMMAFFLVMWIMGMDQGTRNMVQGYFENPVGFRRGFSGGSNMLAQGNSLMNVQLQSAIIMRRREEEERLRDAARGIEDELEKMGLLEASGAAVDVVITDEGLRIEMMETGAGGTFFERSSSALRPALREVLATVAGQVERLPNGVIIEGHTDAVPFPGQRYSNWELSAERANAARRALVDAGMSADHVMEVRGYAARVPRVAEDHTDPRNRRISLLMPFDSQDPSEAEAVAAAAAAAAAAGGVATGPGAPGETP